MTPSQNRDQLSDVHDGQQGVLYIGQFTICITEVHVEYMY